jgi:hypothetical protein
MDETVITTSPNGLDAATIAIASPSAPASSLQQTVCDAAAFGWAITELLGRCYLLPDAVPPPFDWSGAHLVLLQQIYTPREKIRSLMVYIRDLADTLGLSSCTIDRPNANDPDNGRHYVDVLEELVKLYCQHQPDPSPNPPPDPPPNPPPDPATGSTHEQLRGKINERLFYWDLQIHDALQDRPTVVPKAYLVGRTLAALRWYIGLQDQQMDGVFVEKVCQEYIPIMAPYISPYATRGVANSVELWWKAISSGQVQPGPDGAAPVELQKQADIWFSLLTNERTSLSFVPPSLAKASSHYTWKILQLYWPFFAGGVIILVVILALLLVVLLSHYDLVAKGIAAAAGFIAASGVTHMLGSNLGGFLQKATTDVEATKGSVIGSIRESAEQQAVVKSTYIAPAGTSTPKNV